MKNTTIKYLIILVILVALVVLVSALSVHKTTSQQPSLVAPEVQQGTQTVKVAPKIVVPVTGNDYVDSQAQYYVHLNACKSAASSQYSSLYMKILDQSAVQSYYNTKTGICYAQVTGTIRSQYSTSTTDELYFRNVDKNILLMECTNAKGVTFSDSDWNCTDKTTGQTINKAQYESMLSRFTVQ
jgi:hypothetical protein